MTLRLPEPLPYDYVDALIDSRLTFQEKVYHLFMDCDEVTVIIAYPRGIDARRGNTMRMMMELIDDHPKSLDEDSEGYAHTPMDFSFLYTAEPMTEEEVDRYLGIDLIRENWESNEFS